MTKIEAKKELSEGKKITHEYFCENEFVVKDSSDNDFVVFEDGVKQEDVEFWTMRSDSSWNEGWEIFK